MSTLSNYSARSKKKMKESEFNDEDRISKLPEDLLHHIFSFLDMKFVIQTSILSKRWRYFWISQPIMNFDQEFYHPRYDIKGFEFKCQMDFEDAVSKSKFEGCTDFVERALSLHGASKIHTFRLSCRDAAGFWNVLPLRSWMPVLDRCKVEVIDVVIDRSMYSVYLPHTKLKLPKYLFRCRTLTTLKLDLGANQEYRFYTAFPECGSFRSPLPSLKTLHLISFCLYNDFQDFLPKCPVLETLVLTNCSVGLPELKLQHEQLKNLVIETTCSHRIRVIAPNLESFRGRGEYPIHGYCFENMKSLVKADIDTGLLSCSYYYCANVTPILNPMKTNDSPKVMECLRGLTNVRSLMLSAWLLELAIEFPADIGNFSIKPFGNLKLLTLKTSFSKCQIRATTHLLEKCQNLETLVLKMTKPRPCKCVREVHSNAGKGKECWEAELAPLCEMHHLKVVEIWDVRAAKNEFEFVKFLLKNAVVLEKVILYTSKTQSPNNNWELKRFGEKLTTLPGVSSRIGIFML